MCGSHWLSWFASTTPTSYFHAWWGHLLAFALSIPLQYVSGGAVQPLWDVKCSLLNLSSPLGLNRERPQRTGPSLQNKCIIIFCKKKSPSDTFLIELFHLFFSPNLHRFSVYWNVDCLLQLFTALTWSETFGSIPVRWQIACTVNANPSKTAVSDWH